MITYSGLIISLFTFGLSLFAFPTFIFGSAFSVLVFSGLAVLKVKQSWRVSEMTALAPWLAISILAVLELESFSHAALLAGGLGLALSYFTITRLPALMGGLSLIILFWLHSFSAISPETLTSTEGALLTASLFGYMGLAGRVSSRGVLGLALILLGCWGGLWLSGSGLSSLAISSFVFVTAAALYQLGKAALDEEAFGATAFIVCGWIVGFIAFLFLQNFHLNTEANILSGVGKSAYTSTPWSVGICCALACIFASGLSRHKHDRQNILSISLVTLAFGVIPFLAFYPGSLQNIFAAVGLPKVPTTGLILGAFGTFAALSLSLKGLRQRQNLPLYLGFSALGAQTVLLLQNSIFTIESLMVFGLTFLILTGLSGIAPPSKS
ncbi:hypothetical protein [Litorimonas haliclonae]|uniref:hypothetical protein n=1 Tax=Litorimonas haliclonae TaxID=2081977 RepID=UPI0039EF8096